eukprot:GDKK01011867.1.p2 GENE.GDKK01011867.1~~GDKK01011867.1.p2  ORF type:complete len:133 (+),score=7.68 GDKK01011867.1:254-652(+)
MPLLFYQFHSQHWINDILHHDLIWSPLIAEFIAYVLRKRSVPLGSFGCRGRCYTRWVVGAVLTFGLLAKFGHFLLGVGWRDIPKLMRTLYVLPPARVSLVTADASSLLLVLVEVKPIDAPLRAAQCVRCPIK